MEIRPVSHIKPTQTSQISHSSCRYSLAGDPDFLAEHPPDWANDTLVNPIYNIHSLDYRCGRNGTVTGPNSDIATVVAGSKVGFRPGFYNVMASLPHFIMSITG